MVRGRRLLSIKDWKGWGALVLFAWLNIFSPLLGTDSKATHHRLSLFSAQCPMYCKSSRCGPFRDVRAQSSHAQICFKLATQKGNDLPLPKR